MESKPVLALIFAWLKLRFYSGAGIMFCVKQDSGFSILLAQRRHSGIWSIPGGGSDKSDANAWATACRETTEEFGGLPAPDLKPRFHLTYPFGIVGFAWTTYVVELPEVPPSASYPDRFARDFRHEFSNTTWFPITALPPKTHWLLYPVIWRLILHDNS